MQNYAFDLNSTNEIITQASEATVEVQNEIEAVIETTPVEVKVVEDDINRTLENNLTEEIETEEVNSTIPSPTIESVLQIEENLTAEVNGTIEETNTTTLNKETFDMSKGSLEKGEEIYKKQLKKICETKESELSEHYSQDEWEAFASEGKFENAIFEICPQIEPSYNKEWSSDLYQFYYHNARDKEEIPEC
jgi:SHS2 domain-containing protein